MISLTSADFRPLADVRPATCVSLYMPVSESPAEFRQAVLRLKNLLGDARRMRFDKGGKTADGDISVHRTREKTDTDSISLAILETIQAEGRAFFLDPEDVVSREGAAAILRW